MRTSALKGVSTLHWWQTSCPWLGLKGTPTHKPRGELIDSIWTKLSYLISTPPVRSFLTLDSQSTFCELMIISGDSKLTDNRSWKCADCRCSIIHEWMVLIIVHNTFQALSKLPKPFLSLPMFPHTYKLLCLTHTSHAYLLHV